MPYRRRYRKFYRRKRRGAKYTTMGSIKYLANKAYNGVRYIKSMINSERHFTDTSLASSTTVDSTGLVTLLSGCAQGDDYYQRQGNSILAKNLYGRFSLTRNSLNSAPLNSARVIIIKDLMNTGSAPTISDILVSTNVVSPLVVDHASRYQVLMDKVYSLPLNGNEGYNVKFFRKVNDHIKFTGANATDVYKNALYLLLIGDISSANNPPTLTFYSRLSFYDN